MAMFYDTLEYIEKNSHSFGQRRVFLLLAVFFAQRWEMTVASLLIGPSEVLTVSSMSVQRLIPTSNVFAIRNKNNTQSNTP